MSDAIETKILSMLDALQNGVITVAGQTIKYAPDVMQAALSVTVINGVQDLMFSIIFLLALIIFVFILIFGIKQVKLNQFNDGWQAFGVVGCFFSSVCFLISICNVWMWVEIFNPKLYIAHQIVQQVLK